MINEPKPKGRKPGNQKYPASIQIPCTPEMREEVELMADNAGMTVPAFLRRLIDSAIREDARDTAAEDGWNNR